MAVTDGDLILLRMVRGEELALYPELLARLREGFPGRGVVWATTAPGAQVLRAANLDVADLVLAPGGLSPRGMLGGIRNLRATDPRDVVVVYENPQRRGNLLPETLALLSGARFLWQAVPEGAPRRLSRVSLLRRVVLQALLATLLLLMGLAAGCIVLLALPAAAVAGRSRGADDSL